MWPYHYVIIIYFVSIVIVFNKCNYYIPLWNCHTSSWDAIVPYKSFIARLFIARSFIAWLWHHTYTSHQKKGIFWFVGRYCSISFTTKNIGDMEIFGHQFCIYWTQITGIFSDSVRVWRRIKAMGVRSKNGTLAPITIQW